MSTPEPPDSNPVESARLHLQATLTAHKADPDDMPKRQAVVDAAQTLIAATGGWSAGFDQLT